MMFADATQSITQSDHEHALDLALHRSQIGVNAVVNYHVLHPPMTKPFWLRLGHVSPSNGTALP